VVFSDPRLRSILLVVWLSAMGFAWEDGPGAHEIVDLVLLAAGAAGIVIGSIVISRLLTDDAAPVGAAARGDAPGLLGLTHADRATTSPLDRVGGHQRCLRGVRDTAQLGVHAVGADRVAGRAFGVARVA